MEVSRAMALACWCVLLSWRDIGRRQVAAVPLVQFLASDIPPESRLVPHRMTTNLSRHLTAEAVSS